MLFLSVKLFQTGSLNTHDDLNAYLYSKKCSYGRVLEVAHLRYCVCVCEYEITVILSSQNVTISEFIFNLVKFIRRVLPSTTSK